MNHWCREQYRNSVRKHGAAAVARVTKMPRTTILSVVAGVARPGSDLIAESRVDLLRQLDRPKSEERAR